MDVCECQGETCFSYNQPHEDFSHLHKVPVRCPTGQRSWTDYLIGSQSNMGSGKFVVCWTPANQTCWKQAEKCLSPLYNQSLDGYCIAPNSPSSPGRTAVHCTGAFETHTAWCPKGNRAARWNGKGDIKQITVSASLQHWRRIRHSGRVYVAAQVWSVTSLLADLLETDDEVTSSLIK